MSIGIFYHLFCIEDSHLIFEQTYNRIKRCGLFDKVTTIFVMLVGPEVCGHLNYLEKFEKVQCYVGKNHRSEKDSLDLIWNTCQIGDFKLLYLHSKGVTFGTKYRPDTTEYQVQCVKSWKNYMEYFTIDLHETCLKMLNEYDTCGVELTYQPQLHYSGNFWWVNSSYIRNIPKFDYTKLNHSDPERAYCEFWVTDYSKVKVANLHSNGMNMYHNIYSEENYKRV